MGGTPDLSRHVGASGFFVPMSSPATEERVYASLAAWCKCPIPPLGQRIYSIVFGSEGEEWSATVGQRLRFVSRGRKWTRRVEGLRELWIGDPARVLGIFGDTRYVVVTDHLMGGAGVDSMVPNPLVVDEPRVVVYFAMDKAASQKALWVAPSQNAARQEALLVALSPGQSGG